MSLLTRPRVTLAVKVVVSVVLLVVLVSRAGLNHIGATLAAASPAWLVLGFVLGVVAALLQANQWRGLLLALGLNRSYWRCLRLDTAARVFDAALPSSIGGDVARVTLISRVPLDRGPAAMSVVLRRIAQLPGLAVLMALGLVGSTGLPYVGRVRPVALLALGAGAVLVALTATAARVTQTSRIRLPGVVRKLSVAWSAARAESAGNQRRPFLRAGLRGLAFWSTVVLSQWCFMLAVHINAPLRYAALVVTTVNALSLLPISLGGYGLREGAFSAFLAVGGLASTRQGIAVGVCLSAQTLVFGLVGGLVYLTLGSQSGQRDRSRRGRSQARRRPDRPTRQSPAPVDLFAGIDRLAPHLGADPVPSVEEPY